MPRKMLNFLMLEEDKTVEYQLINCFWWDEIY